MIARDIHRVFLNVDEFAEKRTIRYDGKLYEDIPVSLQDMTDSDRERRRSDDYAQGLHRTSAILFCAATDVGGVHFEKNHAIEIIHKRGGKRFSRKFTISSSSCEMGMVEVELEAVTQP